MFLIALFLILFISTTYQADSDSTEWIGFIDSYSDNWMFTDTTATNNKLLRSDIQALVPYSLDWNYTSRRLAFISAENNSVYIVESIESPQMVLTPQYFRNGDTIYAINWDSLGEGLFVHIGYRDRLELGDISNFIFFYDFNTQQNHLIFSYNSLDYGMREFVVSPDNQYLGVTKNSVLGNEVGLISLVCIETIDIPCEYKPIGLEQWSEIASEVGMGWSKIQWTPEGYLQFRCRDWICVMSSDGQMAIDRIELSEYGWGDLSPTANYMAVRAQTGHLQIVNLGNGLYKTIESKRSQSKFLWITLPEADFILEDN